jgi:hypothetical protein
MKKYLLFILPFCLLIISFPALSQAPPTEWTKEIKSSSSAEDIRVILPAADGTVVLAGSTASQQQYDVTAAPKGASDFWLIKMNGQSIVWQKRYGGNHEDVLTSAKQTPDGGYILWGLTRSSKSGDLNSNLIGSQDIWLVKVDANGTLQWQQRYGQSGTNFIGGVHPHQDGGYLIGGSYTYTDAQGKFKADGWIIKTDQAGTPQWEKTLKSLRQPNTYNFYQYIHAVTEIEGNYYFYSTSAEVINGSDNLSQFYYIENVEAAFYHRFTKMNAEGTILIDKLLTDDSYQFAQDGNMLCTSEKHFLVFSDGGNKILKVDAAGTILWTKNFDPNIPENDTRGTVRVKIATETVEGDYILTGETDAHYGNIFKSINKGYRDGLIMKISKSGSLVWSRNKGTTGFDRIGAALPFADGTILTADLYNGSHTQHPARSFYGALKISKLAGFIDTEAPSVPAELNVTTTPCSSQLQWRAATDNYELDGYLLYHNDKLIYNGEALSYSFVSTFNTEYSFTLYALDAQGNRSAGTSINFTTPTATNAFLGTSKVYTDYSQLHSLNLTADGTPAFILYDQIKRQHSLVKTSAKGDIQWQHLLSEDGDTFFSNLLISPDSKYIVAGSSKATTTTAVLESALGDFDFVVAKLDENGTVLWKRRFGGTKEERLVKMIAHPNGGYVLAGTTRSLKEVDISEDPRSSLYPHTTDLWILHIDESGNKVWDKRLGGTEFDQLGDLFFHSSGHLYVGGIGSSPVGADLSAPAKGGNDFLLWKLTSTGQLLWDKRYGGSSHETLVSIKETSYQNLILAGTTLTHQVSHDISEAGYGSTGNEDYWLVSIEAESGFKLWDKRFGGIGNDALKGLVVKDKDIYLFGESASEISGTLTTSNKGGTDVWILKIDETGKIAWQQSAGAAKNDVPSSAAILADGSLLLGASTLAKGCDVLGYTSAYLNMPSAWLFQIFETEDIQKPSAPTNLTASETPELGVQLSWSPSLDDRGVLYYRIYKDGQKLGDVERLTFLATNLERTNEYTFEVSAFDLAGNEGDRATISILILAATEELFTHQQPEVYPVPFRDQLRFKMSLSSGNNPVQLILYDMKGNAIQGSQRSFQDGTYSICEWKPEHPLASGLYLYRYYYNQKWYSGKIIRE